MPNPLHLHPYDGRAGEFDPALAAALVAGGDTRLRVDPRSGLNAYGCSPTPRGNEISLSSTTASTISSKAFLAAEATFERLRFGEPRQHERYANAMDSIRQALIHTFGWPEAEVIFSPSGTDSEILLQHLARQAVGEPLTSIIVAADETGSGVPLAAAGRHFGDVTSGGRTVTKGEPVAGLTHPVVQIAVRDVHGELRSLAELDREVERAVTEAVRSGHRAILHVMEHSKTGAGAPSTACVADLEATYGAKIQVVVDACQFRASASHLAGELRRGRIVLLTGSKFFAGPPLSGAIVLPAVLSERLRASPAIPIGLSDYSVSTDWPPGWDLRVLLPDRINLGQMLRWTAAMAEMERYKRVPLSFRIQAITTFGAAMNHAFSGRADVSMLDAPAEVVIERGDEFACQTVFPFTMRTNEGAVGPVAARRMYQALNVDMSGLVADDRAARLCHVGQPVNLGAGSGSVGALRMSIDARFIADCWDEGRDGIGQRTMLRCREIGEVLDKVSLLLPRLGEIEPYLRQVYAA